MRQIQVLREIYQITEMRDDSVYKSVKVGELWIPFIDDERSDSWIREHLGKEYMGVTLSTSDDRQSIRTIVIADNA